MKPNCLRLIISAIVLIFSIGAVAVPADKRLMKIKQANGKQLTIRLLGDEHRALWTSVDGFPLMKNKHTGNYEYAVIADNQLVLSGIIANEIESRDETTNRFLAAIDRQEVAELLAQEHINTRKAKADKRKILINDFPTRGEPHTLIVLVEFDDVKFSTISDPYDYYLRLLNQPNFIYSNGANGSASDFYRLSSNGLFRPKFDVVGPVTLSNSYSFYGQDEGNDIDVNMGEFLVEACEQADELVDFTHYDTNNDGCVDNIYFFYAGFGEADSGISDVIWPQAGTLSEWGKELTLDGMVIDSYACSQEISGVTGGIHPNGIGTFVHEFGHVLGLADHYDTSYKSETQHPGAWDAMASGSYNDNQHHPPLFSAFERAELGWMNYTDIEPNEQVIDVEILATTNKAYRIVVPETDGNEYFILENRQRVNEFEMTLPGKGLLVWHVDMNEEVWKENTVNCKTDHQHLDIVEADNLATANTLAGDAFPGPNRVKQFDFIAWNGEKLFSFTNVIEKENSVEVHLTNGEENAIENIMTGETDGKEFVGVHIYNVNGQLQNRYSKGINIVKSKNGDIRKVLK